MTWSQEISQLITDVDQLTSAANVKKSVFDASIAGAEADKNSAIASASAAAASAATSLTRAQESETHRNTALTVYGTTATQQSSVISTQGSAALASGYAASASAALQQDLSGITVALHRSPNAITSMFIYDTSKDSDGGAWTEKCQNTSWYNEIVHGKWLGPHLSENFARYSNATLGSELITNGNFSNGSTGWTLSGFAIVDGVAVSNSASGIFIRQNVTTVPGKLYRIEYNAKLSASLVGSIVRLNSLSNGGTTNVTGPTNSFGTIVEYVIAGSATTGLEIITTAGSNIFSVDNVSLREVTAINTTSGDYFQLMTDGKFYRLWKNLLSRSEEFDNATWGNVAGVVNVSANVTTAPDGTLTADKLIPAAATNWQVKRHAATVAAGIYTFSVYAKEGETGVRLELFASGTGGSIGAVFNLNTGAVVVASASVQTAVGSLDANGFRRYSITLTATPGSAGFDIRVTEASSVDTQMTGDGVKGIFVWGSQLELGSVATTYEAKTTISSISEVFRGNKRDFPRLAGIVAEATNVTIYDLTEPGRPMWRRFRAIGTDSNIFWYGITPSTSVAVLNGELDIGLNSTTGNYGGMLRLQFPNDKVIKHYNGSRQSSSVDNIATANDTLFLPNTIPLQVMSTSVSINSIAMTIMPDAPTDPMTGLRIPTVAIATGAGVSIIKQDGTVVSGDNQGTNNITITPNIMTWFNTAYTSGRYLLNPGKITVFPSLDAYNQSTTEFGANNNTQRDFTAKRGLRLRSLTSTGMVKLLNQNDVNIARGLTGKIGSNFNAGWMPGNICRVYLSDNLPGTATVNIQLEDFSTYANDAAMKLVWNQGSAANGSLVGGKLRLAAASGTALGRSWPTIPGKAYSISVTVATGNVAAIRLGASSYSVSYGQFSSIGIGTYRTIFTATGTLFHAGTYGNVAGISEISNFTLTEIEVDRSYKAQSATITGNLTKTQLASGSSLVGYSGWSNSNYLQEPYSADLDFGTGEWSASAWINSSSLPRKNILTYTDDLSGWGTSNVTRTLAQPDPFGGNTATQIITTISAGGVHTLSGQEISTLIVGQRYTAIYNMKGIGIGKVGVGSNVAGTGLNGVIAIDLLAGTFSGGPSGFINKSIQSLGDGWWRFSYQFDALQPRMSPAIYVTDASFNNNWNGDGTSGYLVSRVQIEIGSVATEYQPVLNGLEYSGLIFDRAAASGQRVRLVMNGLGQLTAEAFDGTTTRTVTTTTPHVTGQWLKAEANYTTDGSLSIRVNGRDVAITRGNPLLTLNNTSAILTVGNSFALDAPFPESIALLKLGATVPTIEQSIFMYEQEKQLFRTNAASVLPDTNPILDMSYDDATDRWSAISTANKSYWNGLVRTSVTPVPTGLFSKIATTSGIELAARTTMNQGVDITIPAYVLREELVKRSEQANKLSRQIAIYDYIGGFTGNITTGSTAITTVTNLTYPVSPVGARISGTGIPTNATIVAVSGTTIYISAAATATTTGLLISFLDFELPIGFETESVTTAGVVRQEGTTKDYTRLFDGFVETIRFAVAPGVTTWVRIQASKSS